MRPTHQFCLQSDREREHKSSVVTVVYSIHERISARNLHKSAFTRLENYTLTLPANQDVSQLESEGIFHKKTGHC